jgi:hypothetical protein
MKKSHGDLQMPSVCPGGIFSSEHLVVLIHEAILTVGRGGPILPQDRWVKIKDLDQRFKQK